MPRNISSNALLCGYFFQAANDVIGYYNNSIEAITQLACCRKYFNEEGRLHFYFRVSFKIYNFDLRYMEIWLNDISLDASSY